MRDASHCIHTDDLKDNLIAKVNYGDADVKGVTDVRTDRLKEGDWVVVVYDNKCYPGQVTKVVEDESVKVNVIVFA